MSHLTRRDMLQQLAGCSLAALTSPFVPALQSKVSDEKIQGQATEPANAHHHRVTLNVLFHGLFVFLLRADGSIQVLTPAVGGHVYGWGIFRREIPLKSDDYPLNFKEGQNPQGIDNTSIPIIPYDQSGITAVDPDKRRYCSITLPKPSKLRALHRLRLQRKVFKGDLADQINRTLKHVSDVHVLTYYYQSWSDIYPAQQSALYSSAREIYGFERLKSLLKRRVLNVHVWGEPVFDLGDDHDCDVFKATKSMLPGLKLDLETYQGHCEDPSLPHSIHVRDSGPSDGISKVEKEGLRGGPSGKPAGGLYGEIPFGDPPLVCGKGASLVIAGAPSLVT